MPTQTAITTTSLTVTDECIYCYCREDRGGEMVGCDNSARICTMIQKVVLS